MPISQNGFPANDRSLVSSRLIPGTQVRVTVRNGPAGDLLLYAASRWDREVEDIDNARGGLDDWGYAERPIRGGTELSNHASGTAIDLNATRHPLGQDPSRSFTPDQIRSARQIVADCAGALRWGGDYTGRADGMHLEVDASEARCAAALERLTGARPDTATVRPTLRRGDCGTLVGLVQRFLGIEPDEIYGEDTERAVIAYQRMRGLEPDGVVGPLTWQSIGL